MFLSFFFLRAFFTSLLCNVFSSFFIDLPQWHLAFTFSFHDFHAYIVFFSPSNPFFLGERYLLLLFFSAAAFLPLLCLLPPFLLLFFPLFYFFVSWVAIQFFSWLLSFFWLDVLQWLTLPLGRISLLFSSLNLSSFPPPLSTPFRLFHLFCLISVLFFMSLYPSLHFCV